MKIKRQEMFIYEDNVSLMRLDSREDPQFQLGELINTLARTKSKAGGSPKVSHDYITQLKEHNQNFSQRSELGGSSRFVNDGF